jgi:sugar phosphate permease
MVAGALGGMVSQPLFAYLIKEAGKWEVGWLASGLIALVGLIAVFFLKSKPADYGQHIDGISPEEAAAAGADQQKKAVAKTYRATEGWTLPEAMRTKSFWFLTLSYCVFSMSIYIVTAHGLLHMTDVGYTRMQGAWVLSFFVLGGLARLVVGYIGDIIEPRWIISLLLLLTCGSLITFWQAPSMTALATATCIHGACYGGGLVLIPACIGNYFSAGSFAKLNSFIYPANIATAAIVPAGAGYIHQFNKSYDLAFIIIITLVTIAFFGALTMSPPVKAKS